MVTFIAFLGGALAASAALGLSLYTYIRKLRKQEKKNTSKENTLRHGIQKLRAAEHKVAEAETILAEKTSTFESSLISYQSLKKENDLLKQDLFNLIVAQKKGEADFLTGEQRQKEIVGYANAISERYLEDNIRWISDKLTTKNFAGSNNKLRKIISHVRNTGYDVSPKREAELVNQLKIRFEKKVQEEFQREEQARIRAQIREEQKLEREIEKQLKDSERETKAIEQALEIALQQAQDEHSSEIEALRAKLRESEERAERAKSQAQMTKAGYVYVISNIGSFGENIFKIGMTRRLEPMDRVKELGDASVPFPFDVHMMISCDDAPSLENTIHRELHKLRLNKINNRKEFFRTQIGDIVNIVQNNHGTVDYQLKADASEYRESLALNDADEEYLDKVIESVAE